jgi:ABC-2 type transport system ATP-binding protein
LSQPVIETRDLRRTFKAGGGLLRRGAKTVEAVKGIDLVVERGELFGLLGPNGAGKTTTIKMLITLLLPTSGSATVLGHDVAKDPVAVRRKVGYVFGGDRGLYERLSGLDNLRYFAELYGVPPREAKLRISEMLDLVGLAGREKEQVEGYSRGMRQRLHIARGLLHRPEVLFLDEPSIGVDPVGARALRSTVKNLVDNGTTVLLTTHYMLEADDLCDRLAVIANGQILVTGTSADLKQLVTTGTVIEVNVYDMPDGLQEKLRAEEAVQTVTTEERGQETVLTVYGKPAADISHVVLGHLADSRFGRLITREPTLEDAYVELVNAA